MHVVLVAAAAVALVAWIVLTFARGAFWSARIDAHLSDEHIQSDEQKCVTVYAVVPARNEAQAVGTAVASLTAQEFDGAFRVFLVDDHSEDETAEIARAAAAQTPWEQRLEIVRAAERPGGWTGKLNAMECGVRAALTTLPPPDYWLFTDADIRHDAGNVRALVAKARSERLAMVSLMVRLHCASAWERLLIPAFVFFFQKLYPFAWVNDPARETAAAAGGCILLSHGAFARMGGLRTIHDRLIDDCSLAGAVKATGGTIWLGLTDRTESIRRYDTLDEIWAMVKRTAYTQLDYSPVMLGVALAGMVVLYVMPIIALLWGVLARDPSLGVLGACAVILQAVVYRPTLLAYGLEQHRALTLPFAAALYAAMTADSAWAHARKRGGVWKGRYHAQSSREQRVRSRGVSD